MSQDQMNQDCLRAFVTAFVQTYDQKVSEEFSKKGMVIKPSLFQEVIFAATGFAPTKPDAKEVAQAAALAKEAVKVKKSKGEKPTTEAKVTKPKKTKPKEKPVITEDDAPVEPEKPKAPVQKKAPVDVPSGSYVYDEHYNKLYVALHGGNDPAHAGILAGAGMKYNDKKKVWIVGRTKKDKLLAALKENGISYEVKPVYPTEPVAEKAPKKADEPKAAPATPADPLDLDDISASELKKLAARYKISVKCSIPVMKELVKEELAKGVGEKKAMKAPVEKPVVVEKKTKKAPAKPEVVEPKKPKAIKPKKTAPVEVPVEEPEESSEEASSEAEEESSEETSSETTSSESSSSEESSSDEESEEGEESEEAE
jgi:hypothetical protein